MAASREQLVENILNDFSSLTQHPEDFLVFKKATSNKFTKTLKSVYDTAKSTESSSGTTTLPELIVKDFDEEQIWQQLELQNDYKFSNFVTDIAKLLTLKTKCSFHTDSTADKEESRRQKLSGKKSHPSRVKVKDSGLNEVNDDEIGYEEPDDIQDNYEENLEGSDEDILNGSDEEISNIKSNLDEKDDKFFDFTGDSDEDLNFDFGPLGQAGNEEDIDDDSDDGGGGEGEENEENRDTVDSDVKQNKRKKSVRFKDDIESKTTERKPPKFKGLNKKAKGSIVDDDFFKLADLEVFLDQEDKKEEKRLKREKSGKDEESDSDDVDEGEEEIDMFEELDSDDEDLHYEDFFDPPGQDVTAAVDVTAKKKKNDKRKGVGEKKRKGNKEDETGTNEQEGDVDENDDDDEEDEDGDEVDSKNVRKPALDLLGDSESEGEDLNEILGGRRAQKKSTFEQRQEKLQKRISDMEAVAIAEKPWQLAGEITAANRPENSLLQENLDFEHMTRLPPEITEETTKTLEELILQRIKDKAFDDVERKVKPKENPFEYKKRITLDQEKSKMSLGEIYEQEYLKQQKKEEEEEKKDPDHESIKKMMTSLFIKLDALSNFHYTPKQAAPEVKIISNQPSIRMEEVAPVSVSDSKLLAPQEVKDKQKGELKGSTEKTKTDKLRERKQKKAGKRERQKDREKRQKLIEKLNPGLGNKYSKERAMKKLEKESKAGRGVTVIKEDKKEKTNLTSSKAFFTQLQDEVTTHISSRKAEKRKTEGKLKESSKKFKL